MAAVQPVVQKQVATGKGHPAVTVLVQKFKVSEQRFAAATARFRSLKRAIVGQR